MLQRTLSTSWRNDEAVLAVANTLAAPLRAADAGLTIPELQARPGAGEGAAEILEASDERAEARAIADWILARRAEIAAAGPDGSGGAGEGGAADAAEQASAAVLVRARRQIPALVEGLEERGLTVHVVGLGGLLHRPEVADVRAVLQCAHDPGRGDALMRLLTGPRFRLGARDLRCSAGGGTGWARGCAERPTPPAVRTRPSPSPSSTPSTTSRPTGLDRPVGPLPVHHRPGPSAADPADPEGDAAPAAAAPAGPRDGRRAGSRRGPHPARRGPGLERAGGPRGAARPRRGLRPHRSARRARRLSRPARDQRGRGSGARRLRLARAHRGRRATPAR